MDGRGGRLALCAVATERWSETRADFRHHFHVGVDDVELDEALDLIESLLEMTDSRLFAAVQGWERPISREEIATLDLHDNFRRSKTQNGFKALPRPWDKTSKRYGGKNKHAHTREEIRAIFDRPIGQ